MALTPKETFEAVKKLWPGATNIIRYNGRHWKAPGIAVSIEHSLDYAAGVDWGNTTEYPLPEPKWRDARPEDVQRPYLVARFRDSETNSWEAGSLCGYDVTDEYMWKAKGAGHYVQCQVRDES